MGKFDDILGPDKEYDIEEIKPKEKKQKPFYHPTGINQRILEAYEESKKRWEKKNLKEEESVGCLKNL